MTPKEIVHVENYWDEECEVPWNYVRITGSGSFEAVATHLFDYISGKHEHAGEARERSLGTFNNLGTAIKVLKEYLRRIHAAELPPGTAKPGKC